MPLFSVPLAFLAKWPGPPSLWGPGHFCFSLQVGRGLHRGLHRYWPSGAYSGVLRPMNPSLWWCLASRIANALFQGSNAFQHIPEPKVPEVGVEPTHGCPYWILSPARLPFRHSGIPPTEVDRTSILLTALPLGKTPPNTIYNVNGA